MADKEQLTKLIQYLVRHRIMDPKDLAKLLGYDLITFIKKYML